MEKQFTVRYGRNYKIVFAIVLPGITVWPFIEAMHQLMPLAEWMQWVSIFGFLGFIILFSVWLAMRVYPPAQLGVNEHQISLKFDPANFLSPTDFTVPIDNITAFTCDEIKGDEYFIIETRNPRRKFQVSASSYTVEDNLLFNEAMVEISERVRGVSVAS